MSTAREKAPGTEQATGAESNTGQHNSDGSGYDDKPKNATIKPNYQDSIEFLRKLYPDGPWMLTAIVPDRKGISTATFMPSEAGQAVAWLKRFGQSHNLYYSVNPPRHRMAKKADKEDIAAVHYLHVDADPRPGEDLKEERERIFGLLTNAAGLVERGLPEPTAIIFSGGGFNALWKLRTPLPTDEEDQCDLAERYNRQIELRLKADSCHNIDRILRLPGTINRPDKKKRLKGRTEALAQLVEFDADRVYGIERFTPAPPKPTPAGGGDAPTVRVSGNVRRLGSVDELPEEVSDRCKTVIVQGEDFDTPLKGKDKSRSPWLFWVCCELVRAECDDDTIYSVITDPDFLISASVLDKGSGAEKYALRQIERAKENAVDPWLRRLNDKHAVIGSMGGKCRVIEEVMDHALGRVKIEKQSFEDFRNRYMHHKVEVGQTKDGEPVHKPVGKWWLEQPKRRQYETMVFAPGRDVPDAFNLWQGFACDARPGDCGLYLEHLRNIICDGDETCFEYLLSWMARAVQQPGEPGETAVVMRGRQGTGKGVAVQNFGALFGRHFVPVTDAKHLVGSFNAHLRDCVLLFGDEAFYAGDKKHTATLKTLITERAIQVEAKGVDAETAPNCVHLIMASNENWVVPADVDDRRFFMLDVSDRRAKDTAYFAAIADQMRNGGREALLHLLQNRDLSNFNVRDVPQTEALRRQKRETLRRDPATREFLSVLREGVTPGDDAHKGANPALFHLETFAKAVNLNRTEAEDWLVERGLLVMDGNQPRQARYKVYRVTFEGGEHRDYSSKELIPPKHAEQVVRVSGLRMRQLKPLNELRESAPWRDLESNWNGLTGWAFQYELPSDEAELDTEGPAPF